MATDSVPPAAASDATDAAPPPASPTSGTFTAGVPFLVQTSELNCGPTALTMVLRAVDPAFTASIDEVGAAVGIQDGQAVSTVRLAIAAAKLGYDVVFRSTAVEFTEAHLRHDFYRRYGDVDVESSRRLAAEARAVGVDVKEVSVPLPELLRHVADGAGVVVLLDYARIDGKPGDGYAGHFVPLVGFTPDTVTFHNQGGRSPEPRVTVSRAAFDAARTADGTDEDIVIVRVPPGGHGC